MVISAFPSEHKCSGQFSDEVAGKAATDVAVRLKSIMAGHPGLLRVGMTEAAGQFIAVDPDLMLSGQHLQLGNVGGLASGCVTVKGMGDG